VDSDQVFGSALNVATLFPGILSLTARRALDRSRDAPQRRAPVGNPTRRIALSVFACGQHKMFRASLWKTDLRNTAELPKRVVIA